MSDNFQHYKEGIIKTKSAKPIELYCLKCGNTGDTDPQVENSLYAYGGCTLIFLCGGFLGCCAIPFCFDECKDADHHCTRCGTLLAVKKAFKKWNKSDEIKTLITLNFQ